VVAGGRRRFHGDHADELEQVVLDHVAQGTGAVVVSAAVADADVFDAGHFDVVGGGGGWLEMACS
jgi:hypothetical protein